MYITNIKSDSRGMRAWIYIGIGEVGGAYGGKFPRFPEAVLQRPQYSKLFSNTTNFFN